MRELDRRFEEATQDLRDEGYRFSTHDSSDWVYRSRHWIAGVFVGLVTLGAAFMVGYRSGEIRAVNEVCTVPIIHNLYEECR